MNFHKNSFIFFETIISLIIVSIIIAVFFKLTYDKSSNSKYHKINQISNQLKKSSPSNTNSKTKFLNVKKDLNTSILIVNEINYLDNEIKLKKYELK